MRRGPLKRCVRRWRGILQERVVRRVPTKIKFKNDYGERISPEGTETFPLGIGGIIETRKNLKKVS